MREIKTDTITDAVRQIVMDAATDLGDDVVAALKAAKKVEKSPVGLDILNQIIDNAKIARDEKAPMCQDTGYAVLFVELGQDVHITGGDFEEAINEGVRRGYKDGYLRKSVLGDPIERKNTGDNTPAIIHTQIVPGDKMKITIAPKGGGSENMSEVKMMKPSDGIEGVKSFVLDRVLRSGGNPCPPVIIGVGIGGTFEKCAMLAKKSLLRGVGDRHPNKFYADLELELLEKINKLGVGPQGLGGTTTALDVHVEVHPCHIASLPVAVNTQCHAARHKEVVL
ncbi:MAG: fumarate hydratase [Candidatus Zixiibacteriota bacterium]|nr:MAG: fumarate hydratase [candidate division Zixibacteria bacterium]HDL02753.1 fumarate hydratase [candidate division Zixibacteria bacterium]